PLATFNGRNATGIWTLKVVDIGTLFFGTVNHWSLTVTRGAEPSVVTSGDGTYAFSNLPSGNYAVRGIPPANVVPVGPMSQSFTLLGTGAVGNFAHVPTVLNVDAGGTSLYLWQAGSTLNLSTGDASTSPVYRLPVALMNSLTLKLAPLTKLTVDLSEL